MNKDKHRNNVNLKQYADRFSAEYPLSQLSAANYCIVYVSSSKGLFSEEQLAQISVRSRQKNEILGITGILLYCNGAIIQVLEGSQERVQALYRVICEDSRHVGVITLYSYPIVKRSFSAWSMGYKTLSTNTLNCMTDQLGFMGDPTQPALAQHSIILSVLQEFYLNNHQH